MINEIRTAFKDNFKNLKWMDKETLIEAEKKADAITDMIGNIVLIYINGLKATYKRKGFTMEIF